MKPLPEQSFEFKALNTAALLFAGLGLLFAVAYVDVSHIQTAGHVATPHDIAMTYYAPGVGIQTLIGLGHIHLLGLFPVFWIIGYIFLHSTISLRWRIFWSVLPYIAFFFDLAGWFLTTYFEFFVYEVIVGGGVFIASLAVMIFVSLYQLWVTPWMAKHHGST